MSGLITLKIYRWSDENDLYLLGFIYFLRTIGDNIRFVVSEI